jgi:hypothetical protein
MPVAQRFLIRLSVWLIFIAALTAGCSSGGIKGVMIKGKIVKNGELVKVRSGDTLIIYFVSTQDGRRVRSQAIYTPADGTFVCDGPSRQGTPTGKMRIEVYPSTAEFPPNYNDYLFNNVYKGESTPLEVTVTEDNCEKLVIDLGTKKVTPPG